MLSVKIRRPSVPRRTHVAKHRSESHHSKGHYPIGSMQVPNMRFTPVRVSPSPWGGRTQRRSVPGIVMELGDDDFAATTGVGEHGRRNQATRDHLD